MITPKIHLTEAIYVLFATGVRSMTIMSQETLKLIRSISIFVLFIFSMRAFSLPIMQDEFIKTYPHLKGTHLDSCTTCHMPVLKNFLNTYGQELKEKDYNYAAIEKYDSDDDGTVNIDEINAKTYPGSAAGKNADEFLYLTKKGNVSFHHGKHIANKNYGISWNCSKCHFKEGFPRRFKMGSQRYQVAHKLCIGCHSKSKKSTAPLKCSECHIERK